MKLRVSYAIVFLVVSSVGTAFHQIGSFASKEICEKEIQPALASMGLSDPLWPDAFTPPATSTTFKALFDGNILKAGAPGACEIVSASTIKSVQFSMDGIALPADAQPAAAPWTCNLDTTRFGDGRHTLGATVTHSDGKVEQISRRVFIQNTTAPLQEMLKLYTVHSGCVRKS